MNKIRLLSLVVVLVALLLNGAFIPQRAETASVDPSWDLAGASVSSNTCTSTGSGFALSNVYVNITDLASERGSLTAEGFGEIGYTNDSSFGYYTGVIGFFVFTTPYSLPAHTLLTLTVTTYKEPSYAGGVSYISSMTWDCSTGERIVPRDALLPIPATAVGGTFVADAPTYWAPGQLTSPLVTIKAGNSAWVLGLDASGEYYKIIWAGDYLWVPKATLGPNYDALWNGAPLPTGVVQ